MILTLGNGQSFDTETDLNAPERHILQKLFFWKSMASSVEEFRKKKAEALQKGWNQSGPIGESAAMRAITQDLEEKVMVRLSQEKGLTSSRDGTGTT
jgi:hypothetical protein